MADKVTLESVDYKDQLLAHGGLTVPNTPSSGYMVGISPEDTRKISFSRVTNEQIENFIAFAHYLDLSLYAGAWLLEGTVYLDICRHFESKEEALLIARECNQYAIYDIENDCDIYVNTNNSGNSLKSPTRQAVVDRTKGHVN